jgi:regulator of protease activity HflC (stomatin/prohibitin superfamily)
MSVESKAKGWPTFQFTSWLSRWYWQHRSEILVAVLVAMFVFVVTAPQSFISIPPGHLGVLWSRFSGGTVLGPGIDEGLRTILPWDRLYIYDARLLSHDEVYDVVTMDGLTLKVQITFRWRVRKDQLGLLHRDIGPDYLKTLLVPELGSISRTIIASHVVQDLITGTRIGIQQNIFAAATGGPVEGVAPELAHIAEKYVAVEDVLIRDVILPEQLKQSIERKLEQAQFAQEYDYRLASERAESERKAIEAEGIHEFQRIVQSGISETYLKWRGIEATLELAKSPNAKVVIIGGQNGLPVILNTNATPGPSDAPVVSPPPDAQAAGTVAAPKAAAPALSEKSKILESSGPAINSDPTNADALENTLARLLGFSAPVHR